MDIRIKAVKDHYGFITAFVEHGQRMTDVDGVEFMPDVFYFNGGNRITCEGFKVKKDGTLYARGCCMIVHTPENVKKALHDFRDGVDKA